MEKSHECHSEPQAKNLALLVLTGVEILRLRLRMTLRRRLCRRSRQNEETSHGGCRFLWLLIASTFVVACPAQPRVVVSTQEGRELAFKVEVADTPAERELGLQYRQELAPDQGMLFVFPQEAQQSFWMKNTPIPLDMIFIGKDRKIVGIVEEAVPFTLTSRAVDAPSQFVLEIRGGLSRSYGIRPGDRVRFEGISVQGGSP